MHDLHDAAERPPNLRRASRGSLDALGTGILYLLASAPLLIFILLLVRQVLRADHAELDPFRLFDLAVGVAGLVLLRWRERWPWQVALLTAVPTVVFWSLNGPAIVAFASLAAHRRWRQVVPVAVVFWLSIIASTLWWQSNWLLTALYALVGGVGLTALTVFGLYLRGRRELHEAQRAAEEAAQAQRVEQAKLAERLKIAQEMHDVLAHRISLLAMLAGGLAYRKDLSPEQTREAALAIQENAHQSLNELRAVLGTLRRGSGPEAPQPTLEHLDALFAEVRAAGQRVEVDDSVDRRELLPAQTGRHAYRIVQEALTNARKHAPGSSVRAEIGGRPGSGLRIRVSNPAPAGAPAGPGGRLGLVGLAERTRMAGGSITHDVRDGRFVLDALLPWEA
ncbi:sensor histidine kinase [Nonomuraea rubra]|uniref:histidine kinase n=1 Tax=Nonomuraea rubra TaxID=46180 RepID=A0A7X0NXF3_9ACTN|nr:histidine kinase [Nonomuraea rubra]MBB6551409.1 signal transduction histidine kinase [Nonomuraea rubra]